MVMENNLGNLRLGAGSKKYLEICRNYPTITP